MISSATIATAALADSYHEITHYYKASKKQSKGRYSDYVIIPTKLRYLKRAEGTAPLFTLDYDSDEILKFSLTTIKSLTKNKKKPLPFPLLTDPIDSYPDNHAMTKQLQNHNFINCVKYIENEKQYIPTFHIIGHGSPIGIGPLDPEYQISAHDFADKLARLLRENLPNSLNLPLKFIFRTCNSAYVDVDNHMDRSTILDKVLTESFIGKFYQRMFDHGFNRICAIGFRGYYCEITSQHSSGAQLQDSFTNPRHVIDSKKGEYIIENKKCASSSNDENLIFPVKLMHGYKVMQSVTGIASLRI